MELIHKYFPHLTTRQVEQFEQLKPLYTDWNQKINVVSRKDLDNLYQNHILHSLSIARCYTFNKGHTVADVGTGGGFPGIPLAIMFPDVSFTLIDATAKKLKVVESVAREINLTNCQIRHNRIENIQERYHFVVSRAVTQFPVFVNWVWRKIKPQTSHLSDRDNGIFYLKGGDFEQEIINYKWVQVKSVSDYYQEDFFETKKIIYLPKK
ncbi:MAG: 16S rRNA (guanine(527)-N(7))-methyltransferase RsmG [Bacteroidetes bacterium]|jgi:16S rRNA (guanine527-N7)-methyltransferase|nr:16S rRNA (guanine(527)-N(7))-methyltransferase RsmG [Bacteroidota bacterium]